MTPLEIAQMHQAEIEARRGLPATGFQHVAIIGRDALMDLAHRAKDPLAAKLLGEQIRTIARSAVKNGLTDKEAGNALRKQVIIETLRVHDVNQCHAARALKMHRNTLSRTIDELGINLEKLRGERKKAKRA